MRALLLLALAPLLLSQERPRPMADAAADANDEIRAVVILSRHGVRAPRARSGTVHITLSPGRFGP